MALVGADAGVDRGGDEQAGFGRRDEERLRSGTPLGLFTVIVALGSSILGRKKENKNIFRGRFTPRTLCSVAPHTVFHFKLKHGNKKWNGATRARSYNSLFVCLSRGNPGEKGARHPSNVWYIMYSVAELNPDNLHDLGQSNWFKTKPSPLTPPSK